MTPEQMRALANELQSAAAIDFGVSGDTMFAAQSALRAAADQLEAVQAWLSGQDSAEWDVVDLDALDAILTADTASQKDRDE